MDKIKDYTPKEINDAVSGHKDNFVNLKSRIMKWDLILNEIHEDLKYLHEEFDIIYEGLDQLEDKL